MKRQTKFSLTKVVILCGIWSSVFCQDAVVQEPKNKPIPREDLKKYSDGIRVISLASDLYNKCLQAKDKSATSIKGAIKSSAGARKLNCTVKFHDTSDYEEKQFCDGDILSIGDITETVFQNGLRRYDIQVIESYTGPGVRGRKNPKIQSINCLTNFPLSDVQYISLLTSFIPRSSLNSLPKKTK